MAAKLSDYRSTTMTMYIQPHR
ncbi:hypothetical protein AZE42_13221 [Rhizopogon vesiculosus]|uniref:Uncharacterized protein n=1 Tax=Rhizopogon vesiculosus TaxID=180088 RepID=A0A1J8PSZ8_9AGAM|nr:hypothetical protein AZE42_13221 [Rhizopogon vesiculosus]